VLQAKELPGLLLRDRVRRSTDMVDMAVTYAKMDQDSFLEALLNDEQRRHLLHRAVQAASDATSEEKRRSLAAALAAGTIADDDAVVDDALIVIDAVAQLEAVHLRVLERLTKTPSPQGYGQLADVPNFVPPWVPGQLEHEIPQLRSVMVNLVAKLEALGMVERYRGGIAENCLRLTTFGNMCLGSLLRSPSDHFPVKE
jgi:DNA-binding MarR family transcriptional regulator